MKKIIYSLIIYIGLCITVFNPALSHAQINIPLPFTEELSIKNTSYKKQENAKVTNQFLKLLTAFYLVDKLYPNEKINQDISGLLHQLWPTTKIEKLNKFANFLKKTIMLKRRYAYVIDHLKQKIKASDLLLSEPPIIAKDNEYAAKFSDKRKAADSTDYKISYIPYKYIGYDRGEDGEAVRLRDKNYETVSPSVIDELTLAILQLNIGAFYRALKKLPQQNDGSREKLVELGENIRSRLVMDTMALGKKETVKGFIEVYVPEGLYINGDYLNPKTKPQFIIDENSTEDSNIKDYQIFYPKALGVENGNETSRILVESVRFPLQISRRNLNKDINIKSIFTFHVCRAKTKECRPIISHNNLTLNASQEEMSSMHINAVNIAFARQPQEQTKHAFVKDAVYNPDTQTLTIKFQTSKNFSNIAAMAEDAAETNFLNPQYQIEKNEVTASFHTQLSSNLNSPDIAKNIINGGEIAVTAAFDGDEILRKIITPKINNQTFSSHSSPPYSQALLFALLLPLMPGLFFILENLLILFITHQQRLSILLRFLFGSLLGIISLAIYNRLYNWSQIYDNSWIITGASLLAISYLMQNFDFMDFELFRPLRGKIKRGFLSGLFFILLTAAAPIPLKQSVFNAMHDLSSQNYIKTWILIWLMLLCIPVLCYIFRNFLHSLPLKMHYFNRGYTGIYLLLIIITTFFIRGYTGILVLIISMLLMTFLWYIYPQAITATIKHKRSQENKGIAFDKVQLHATIIVLIIFGCATIIFNAINIKDQHIPSFQIIFNEAENNIKEEKALLFVLNSPWSITSWFNQIEINNLKYPKMNIISYTPATINQVARSWYQKYQKHSPPLHILFTSRHPNGLLLPENLQKIDWQEALSSYKTPTERKE